MIRLTKTVGSGQRKAKFISERDAKRQTERTRSATSNEYYHVFHMS